MSLPTEPRFIELPEVETQHLLKLGVLWGLEISTDLQWKFHRAASVLPEVCVHFLKQNYVHLCVCAHGHVQRPEEGVGCLELELQVLVSCLVWVLGTNLGIQQEQQTL